MNAMKRKLPVREKSIMMRFRLRPQTVRKLRVQAAVEDRTMTSIVERQLAKTG